MKMERLKNAPASYGLDVKAVKASHRGRFGGGSYTGIVCSADKAVLEAWVRRLKEEFHPCGYGTRAEIRKGLKTTNWYCKYWYAGSCG
jgi:hypothetical protein